MVGGCEVKYAVIVVVAVTIVEKNYGWYVGRPGKLISAVVAILAIWIISMWMDDCQGSGMHMYQPNPTPYPSHPASLRLRPGMNW